MGRIAALVLGAIALAACGGEEPPAAVTEVPAGGGATRPADSAYPFQGLWANSFTDCSLAPGSAEAAPIEINTSRFVGYENSCVIDRVVNLSGEARNEVMLTCLAEGREEPRQMYMRVKGDTLMVEMGPGQTVTWTRCPAAEDSEG
jgi:hypothetical protein